MKPIKTVRAAVPTKEELHLIRDHVLLPMMLTMVESNARELELSTHMLRKFYISVTSLLMNQIHKDLAQVNKQLRESKIKVYPDDRVEADLHYRFICRGYEDKFSIMREVAKANISVRIAEYIRALVADVSSK